MGQGDGLAAAGNGAAVGIEKEIGDGDAAGLGAYRFAGRAAENGLDAHEKFHIGEGLDDLTARNLHCHFSKIEWTAAGEKKHLTFEDTMYGPDFEPLAECLAKENLTPTIICESDGTMSDDALSMKKCYERKLLSCKN